MEKLHGFSEYKKAHYQSSCFTRFIREGAPALLLCHEERLVEGVILEESPFDLVIKTEEESFTLPKVEVKACAAADQKENLSKLIKKEKKVAAKKLAPILAPGLRHFIKNKSLFPLMVERNVLFFTLLEGEIIKGLVTGFSRYDVVVHMKGGVEITLLRHAIFDVRDKKGRCYLKSVQKKTRDWKKSEVYA